MAGKNEFPLGEDEVPEACPDCGVTRALGGAMAYGNHHHKNCPWWRNMRLR